MSWNEDMEKIFKAWSDTQENLWKSWVSTPAAESRDDPWGQGLELWQQSIRQTLNAQSDLMEKLSTLVRQQDGTTPDVGKYFPALEAMFGQWSKAQQQLWEQWVETLKNVDPGVFSEAWNNQGDQLMQKFSEATNTMLAAQQQAMKQFLEAFRS